MNKQPNDQITIKEWCIVTNSKLPCVLCIDEFKGNTGNYKYQVALIDGETHEVVDVLECRHKHSLCNYFKKFSKEQLDNVKYFVTDLWETYKDIAFTYFRKAKIVADHFLVMLLIKSELKFKISYLNQKEYILNTLESYYYQELAT